MSLITTFPSDQVQSTSFSDLARSVLAHTLRTIHIGEFAALADAFERLEKQLGFRAEWKVVDAVDCSETHH